MNKKTLILLALIPCLAFGYDPKSYRGIYEGDVYTCVKACRLDRVWGTSWIQEGEAFFVWSVPWTGAGTYYASILHDPEKPIHNYANDPNEKDWGWFYEHVGPVGHKQGCHYDNLSSFLKNREYWKYLGKKKPDPSH